LPRKEGGEKRGIQATKKATTEEQNRHLERMDEDLEGQDVAEKKTDVSPLQEGRGMVHGEQK